MTSHSKAEALMIGASDLRRAVKDVLRETRVSGAVSGNAFSTFYSPITGIIKLAISDVGPQPERARELVLRFGWNATAYDILNPGIELWFSSAGDGVVAFVRHGGMLVVGGGPVCEVSRLDAIAAEFVAAAHARGKSLCYFGAGERLDERYADNALWSRVLLGAQLVWDPRTCSAAVAKRTSLRAQFNRARNKRVTVTEWPAVKAENHPRSAEFFVSGLGRATCRHCTSWSSPRP